MHLFKFFREKVPRPKVTVTLLTLLTAIFIVLFDNSLFWHSLSSRLGTDSFSHLLFMAMGGITLILAFNILLSLLAFKPIVKPFLVLVLLTAAAVGYFSDTFGVVVDKTMIYNVLETDFSEASELLTWPLAAHLFFYGMAPAILVILTRIRFRATSRELMVRSGVVLCSLAIITALFFVNYKEVVLFGRKNRDLRMLINPAYPIASLHKVLKKKYFPEKKKPLQLLGRDAAKNEGGPKTVVVMVVGETARAQELAFNGYQRDTNPYLSDLDIVNFSNVQDFSNVQACGTSTIVSVPCMFSHLDRQKFSRSKARHTENILDILQHTGVRILWRDNNSSSKGVADRVPYENLNHLEDSRYCSNNNCFDEVLLKDLAPLMTSSNGDMLIVLHLKGSHGPSYYRRTPPAFKVFTPECSKANIQDCPRQEIVNAYDNTIVYTDYFLAELIDLLKRQNFATAMLYVSDHGESLGESGIYLHGVPYALAPTEQTQVPMIFWGSEKLLAEKNIDPESLKTDREKPYSHDYIFHSLLGLFDIKTKVYKPDLDLFAAARGNVQQNHGSPVSKNQVTASTLPRPAAPKL
jgi:lipid A ethanolaminephosphotransferase